ncbi:MAG: methylated-DNA--[protein]-cysteine S-methyltransferase [Pirellulales bacterium]
MPLTAEKLLSTAKRPSSRRTHTRSNSEAAAVAFNTDLEWMAVAYADDVLVGIVFGHNSKRNAQDSLRRHVRAGRTSELVDFIEIADAPAWVADVAERLKAYAAGEAVDFRDVAVDERHLTDFGRQIVRACRRIPRGESRTYGELARTGGSPGAARAVGQVMARNRYPLVVPCHRVLAAGGLLGGFSAPQGLSMKRRLLALEELSG